MLIRCPTCASGYDLAPTVLGDRRILRCAHCRDAWVHRAGFDGSGGPAIAAAASASRLPVGPAIDDREAAPARRSSAPAAFAALAALARAIGSASIRPSPGPAAAALLAAVLAGAGSAVACKAPLVELFPPSGAVFAMLGLPVNLSGLALGELRSTMTGAVDAPVLTVEGRITNLRPDATRVPELRIAVRDKDGREIYTWTAPAPKPQLAVGETVVFRSRLTAPPRDGQELAVTFADAARDRRRVAEALPSER